MNKKLINRIKEKFELLRPRLEAEAKIQSISRFPGEQIMFPIVIDGVIDTAIYDVAEKKFVAIDILCSNCKPLFDGLSEYTASFSVEDIRIKRIKI